MRRILSLFLCVCATLMVVAQTRFRTTIPYQNEAGKLIVSVRVNGHPARFLLDTGAPCCITYSFAERLGLKAGQALPGQDSNGQFIQAHLVTLDSLKLGSINFRSLQAMRWEKGNMTEQMGIDGIVGYNLLMMGIAKFDGRRSEFTFTSFSRDLGITPAQALPLLKDKMVPLLPIRLGKETVDTVMFDSGASSFYEMSTTTFQRLGKKHKSFKHWASGHGVLSMGAAGIAQQSELHRIRVPKFYLATAQFRDVPSITTDGRDSRIGSNILHYGDVVIDYPQRLFYYLPHDVSAIPQLYKKEWEVVIIVQDSQLVAGIVWNEKLPIRMGDRILAVNEQRLPERVDLHEATTRALFNMPGDRATLTYLNARTGKEETISIRRR